MSAMPGTARASCTALPTSDSMSRPAPGLIWMVTSRAMSDCHSLAALAISTTAPVVNAARNVMMATTAISAEPEMEPLGTIGVSGRGPSPTGMRAVVFSDGLSGYSAGIAPSIVHVQPPVVDHEASRIELVHQRNVVRGDDDR